MRLIFDVYPLLNSQYTGIPQTTWHLAKRVIEQHIDCLFCIGYRVLERAEIELLIQNRSGRGWKANLVRKPAMSGYRFLSSSDFKERIYFSPHVMSCITARGLGNARFVHDISSLTMPEYHTSDAVLTDCENILIDTQTCDLIFTVSESSKSELMRYLNIPATKISVVYPGVDWTEEQINLGSKFIFDKPYVLVMATKEPRKNRSMVLKYLVKNKVKILESDLLYVFVGPEGWGADEAEGMEAELNELVSAGKLSMMGFFPEELKLALLTGAKYMIFPSFFEGFGSPVAEALSVGTPVICSVGGSLPEVAGSAAFYFMPDSLASLERAVAEAELLMQLNGREIQVLSAKQGARYSWGQFADSVLNKLKPLYEGQKL